MLTTHRSLHDIKRSEVVKVYDKKIRYRWLLDDKKLTFANTRELQSQLKFREKYLETVGHPIAKVTSAEWQLFLAKAFNKNEQDNEEDLKNLLIDCLADYCMEKKATNRIGVFNGEVFWTVLTVIFTLKGFLLYIEDKEEFKHCTQNWFFKIIKTTFNTKENSYIVGEYKCAVFRINLFSTRTPARFMDKVRSVA